MEHNDLPGGIFSGMNSATLLDMPLLQNPQNSHHLHHPQISPYSSHHDSDHHHHLQSQQQSAKISYTFPSSVNPKPQSPLSDEDEPGFIVDESINDGKRKAAAMSPWHRMKWTDNMVRLLIMAVFYIGDEAGSEPIDPSGKKKPGAGLSQKKGKWKSISRAMMEKGFYVSPQQCEDKFNDLNKRYKRVNDILGKGTACKVVENQNLLESMNLSPKMKEEAKKLLNSKHLFFREMCAYHNSCGHISSVVAPLNDLQKGCSHTPENPQFLSEGTNLAKRVQIDEGDEDEEHEDGDDSEEENSEEDECDHEEDDYDKSNPKRPKTTPISTSTTGKTLMQQLNCEVSSVIENGGKSQWEKKHWMKVRLLQLEEQQVKYQYQAFELEKQRLKWVKFSSKKEREMERSKLENERRRLENERMVLLVRQKELEFIDLQQIHHQQQQFSSNKRGDPSSITG